MPCCTVHDPALIARLTGFLVIVPMGLMAPTSLWVNIGASRINELIAPLNRLALSDRVDLNPSPRVRRACQVAIFALVMQAPNHVRFGKVSACTCSDGVCFKTCCKRLLPPRNFTCISFPWSALPPITVTILLTFSFAATGS